MSGTSSITDEDREEMIEKFGVEEGNKRIELMTTMDLIKTTMDLPHGDTKSNKTKQEFIEQLTDSMVQQTASVMMPNYAKMNARDIRIQKLDAKYVLLKSKIVMSNDLEVVVNIDDTILDEMISRLNKDGFSTKKKYDPIEDTHMVTINC